MGNVASTAVKALKMSDSVILAKDLAVSSNYDAATSKIVTETDLNNAIAGLGQALSYAGVADQDPAVAKVTTVNGSTSVEIKAGNVVSYGTKEYLCTAVVGGVQTWKEFGDEGAFVVKNEAITPVATETLLKIKYDAKGLVTGSAAVTKGDIPGMSDKVETSTKIAGLALTGDISKVDLLSALNVTDGATKVEASATNGNIKINGTETKVYELPTDVVQDAAYKHITVTSTSVSDGTTTANIPQGALASKDKVAEADLDTALAAKVHTHDNKDLLDTYKQTEENLADAVAKKHAHANKETLDAITSEVKAGYDSSKASFDAKAAACASLVKLDINTNTETTVADIAEKVDAIIDALKTAAA